MDKVEDSLKCTKCNEDRMDYLEISDDDYITCHTCGNIYDVHHIIGNNP